MSLPTTPHPDCACAAPAPARRRRAALASLLLGAALGSAHAQGLDATLAVGAADEADVKKLSLILGTTRAEPLWQGETWRLKLRHEVELAAWRVPEARNLIELGYSPVLRLERPLSGGNATFFFEGSIGVRLLSHTRVSPQHPLSTAFQFADMLGLGLHWGREARSTLGLRYQHMSNLGIKRPNPGMNFVQLYYTHRF